jgi:hypothetical protein
MSPGSIHHFIARGALTTMRMAGLVPAPGIGFSLDNDTGRQGSPPARDQYFTQEFAGDSSHVITVVK